MDDVFIGQVLMFGGSFIPYGFVACDGSLLSTNDYQTLFSLLGTHYGGDGVNTFGVPDLRGRIPVGQGQGPGRSNRWMGEWDGQAMVTLTEANLPAHNHSLFGINSTANAAVPSQTSMFGNGIAGQILPYNDISRATGTVGAFSSQSITMAGGPGVPHENRMPGVGIQYIMATEGIYPTP